MRQSALGVCVALVMMIATACGGGEETILPTIPPPPTATPSIDNAGQPNNPLRMMIVPHDPSLAARLETRLESAILNLTSVSVDVVLVSTQAEALSAVCQVGTPLMAMAWLDGISYAAAIAQGCGDAALRLQTADNIGERGRIYLRSELDSLQNIADGTLCRINPDDLFSWRLPSLVFLTERVPFTNASAIRDLPTYEALIAGLNRGTCDAIGLPERWSEAVSDETARLAYTSPTVPTGILLYPLEIPLSARLSLNDKLPELSVTLRAAEIPALATATPAPTMTPISTVTRLPRAETTADAETTPDSETTAEATVEVQATARPTRTLAPTRTPSPAPTMATTALPATLNLLDPFLGASAIVPLTDDDLREFQAFLNRTGLNFERLGE